MVCPHAMSTIMSMPKVHAMLLFCLTLQNRFCPQVLEQRFGAFNTYSLLSMNHFYHGMARSKFVLCPSGLGLESYRVWEALLLGAMQATGKAFEVENCHW